MYLIIGCVVLSITSLLAVANLIAFPRKWYWSVGSLLTAAVMLLYLPVRAVFYVPSSFDANGDGFGILLELMAVVAIAGSLHVIFIFVLVSDMFQPPRRD